MKTTSYLFGAAVTLAACIAGGAQAQTTLYDNDFNAGGTANFSGATTVSTTPSGERYLELYNGLFNPGTGVTNLTLDTAEGALNLTFDLYAIRSLDGNGQFGGAPDPFQVFANGVKIFDYTFANFGGDTQSFPGTDGQTQFAARTGATANGTLGYGTGDYGDSTYLISLDFTATGTSTTFTFVGGTNEDEGNENYGIDNVVVTGTPLAGAVPEPAVWTMMIGGFALVGGAMRRRRTAVAYA